MYTCMSVTICSHASHPLWKAEVAYRHHGLTSYISARFSYTLQSYILPNVSHLQVQATYLDELYEECRRTVHACTNSG